MADYKSTYLLVTVERCSVELLHHIDLKTYLLIEVCIFTLISRQLEEFEDNKGVIRIRKSKKDRQHNGQEKK